MTKKIALSLIFIGLLIAGTVYILLHGSYTIAKVPVFKSSFESKKKVLEEFRLDKIEEYGWYLTEKHKHHGDKGLCIQVDKGYKAADNTERSEFQDPLKISLNNEVWYRIDFEIPNDFPEVDTRLVIWQLKQSGGNNPLISMRYRNGKWTIKQRFDFSQINYYQPEKGYKNKNKWIRIVVHTKASYSNTGFVNVYLDDTQIIQYKGQTAYKNQPAKTYFKFGLYRDVVDIPMYIYFDQYIRGSSWQEVVPENDEIHITKKLWKYKKKTLEQR